MRGNDQQQNHIFSDLSAEQRVRKDHPLRAIRAMVDEVLKQLSPRFDTMCAKVGRPSIPPEQLLRAQLLQMPYKEAKLSYSGNLLVENRNGLIVASTVWEATGTAECLAALAILERVPGTGRVVDWVFTFACAAYNLVRMQNLLAAPIAG
ncbi:MAG TPA: hypothetical protein VNJ52_07950 [Patescibacteria group bacterium]|nr:hypothetical protein [Patescibacteria group bacterium]